MSLVEFLTVACTGTSQKTHYNSRKEQQATLDALHQKLLVSNRYRYALTAAFPINDHNRQRIVANLLATARNATDLDLEDCVIAFVMGEIQFNRVLNVLCELVDKKVNNSRTRRIITFVWDRHIDAYRAIKYRDKVRKLLRHAHVPEPRQGEKREIHKWIFGKITKPSQVKHSDKIRSRLRARSEYSEVFNLPFDIARDIAVAQHGKKAEDFAKEFAGTNQREAKGTATRKEKLRAKSASVDVEVDYKRYDMLELLNRAYRNPEERAEIESVLHDKAIHAAERVQLPNRVAIVVDNSRSALGSKERQYHPLAVIEATVRTCEALHDTQTECFYVGQPREPFLEAQGPSNLRMPVARALASRPDLVLILSDGYENVRAGSVSQILQTKAVKESGIAIVHLNPVTAAESNSARKLASNLSTYGLLGPAQLPMALLLGQAETNPELLNPIFSTIEIALKSGDYKAVKSAMKMPELVGP